MNETYSAWLTTEQAAALAGVSVSTLKRWADQGLVECSKTAGRHRRFSRKAVAAVLSRNAGTTEHDAWCARWLAELTGGNALAIDAALLDMRAEHTSWAEAADAFAPVLHYIGLLWERGEISVLQEHVLSERIARTWSRAASTVVVPAHAPRMLLSTACRDEHTLGLSLAEIALREAGWAPVWSGRSTPVSDIVAQLQTAMVRGVALSASSICDDPDALARELAAIVAGSTSPDTRVLLGGNGAWPALLPPGVARVHSFVELAAAARPPVGRVIPYAGL